MFEYYPENWKIPTHVWISLWKNDFLKYRLLAISCTCEIRYQVCPRVRAWCPALRHGEKSNRTASSGVCQREIQASFRNRVLLACSSPIYKQKWFDQGIHSCHGPPAGQNAFNCLFFTKASVGGNRNELIWPITLSRSSATILSRARVEKALHWACFAGFLENSLVKARGMVSGKGVFRLLKVACIALHKVDPWKWNSLSITQIS